MLFCARGKTLNYAWTTNFLPCDIDKSLLKIDVTFSILT